MGTPGAKFRDRLIGENPPQPQANKRGGRNELGEGGVDEVMTAEVPYEVIATADGVELRRYPRHVTADVKVKGSAGSAGNKAFRPLASYINGKNQAQQSLPMTAPVLQEDGEKLGMTAPVLQERDDKAWVVSFVLPGSRSLAEYPKPLDDRIQLREVPTHEAAAIRWSGRWTYSSVQEHTQELLDVMQEMSWLAEGSPVWARYDPPWKPFFLRRNEVIIKVADSEIKQ